MKNKFTSTLLLFLMSVAVVSETTDSIVSSGNVPTSLKNSPKGSILDNWQFQNGDAIRIIAIPDTGFPNGIYPVDGEGYVDLPMIGPLQVTSMSKSECEKRLREVYIPLLRYSSIQLRRVISISFQGGFQSPGVYWVSPGATLWYTISLTGGTIREDGMRRIEWERDGKIMEQKVTELLKNPKPIAELGLKSGDVIRVLARPKRNGWDVIRQDVLPLMSIALSSAVASISFYQWSQRR
jgi:protein involved in polysaccharide export with SLBB domain